jgi:putative sterol carrier protein
MSDVLTEFAAFLHPRAMGRLQGTAKLVLTDIGAVMLDAGGATIADGPADVTLTAREDVFRRILSGDQNAVMAVMLGKLKVDGSATRALKVAEILVG